MNNLDWTAARRSLQSGNQMRSVHAKTVNINMNNVTPTTQLSARVKLQSADASDGLVVHDQPCGLEGGNMRAKRSFDIKNPQRNFKRFQDKLKMRELNESKPYEIKRQIVESNDTKQLQKLLDR